MNKNGSLELSEFYQLYSGLKSGQITQNRLVSLFFPLTFLHNAAIAGSIPR